MIAKRVLWIIGFTFIAARVASAQSTGQWERVLDGYVGVVGSSTTYDGGSDDDEIKPTLYDMDNDNDLDLLVGHQDGTLTLYANGGTSNNPVWSTAATNYSFIDVGSSAAPVFCDVSGDGLADLLVGESSGRLYYFRNTGTEASPTWALVTTNYSSIDVGNHSAPTLCDIDGDSDQELFIGNAIGQVFYYTSISVTGTIWSLASTNYNAIDVGSYSVPTFVDVDGDSDFDLFVGENSGHVHFYENTGSSTTPSWTLVSTNYTDDYGGKAAPVFSDIDADGDQDLLMGSAIGAVVNVDNGLYSVENTGTVSVAAWADATVLHNSIDVGASSAPAFCDIDGDGDSDMFIGGLQSITFYENIGTPVKIYWATYQSDFVDLPLLTNFVAYPTFVDIDNDGDNDLFAGGGGALFFYENTGTAQSESWAPVVTNYNSVDFGFSVDCIPTFCDIDDDEDFDLFVGRDSQLLYYQNTGTPESAAWASVSSNYAGVSVSRNCAPAFLDVDEDADYDLLIGSSDGMVRYYQNTGSSSNAAWSLVSTNYFSLDVGTYSMPAACDVDGDGDEDCLIGETSGGVNFFRNNKDKLTVTPSAVTLVTGFTNRFQALDFSSNVVWSFIQNNSGGSLGDVSNGVIDYVAGSTSGIVDVLEAYDGNKVGRAYINVISESDVSSFGKALVIAGRKSVSDSLWTSTDYLADNAYNTLRYRGFSKANIQYLSHELDDDVDGNEELDDVDDETTWANTEDALTTWATSSDKLFIYIVDHGGDSSGSGYVRLSESEVLTAAELDSWLDDLQDAYNTEVTVVLDFCYAGSFLGEMTYAGTAQRTVIAACSDTELNYFLADGLISFSDAFFSGILSGLTVQEAFENAQNAMSTYQTAWIDDNGDGAYDSSDGSYASTLTIGSSYAMGRDAPYIGTISANQTLSGETSVDLWADDISSAYTLERVWCIVVPPSHTTDDSSDPVADLTEVDLTYNEETERYEVTRDGFSEGGTYKVVFYAEDMWGSVSLPKQGYVTQTNYSEKAILVAAGELTDEYWTEIDAMADTVYHTLSARQISDENIYYFSPASAAEIDASPDMAAFIDAVTNWADSADKLTVYLIGQGGDATLRVNASEELDPATLDAALDVFQEDDRNLHVIIECDYSGTFVEYLQPPTDRERIVIASSKTNQVSVWSAGGVSSFSQYFLSYVFDGYTVGESFSAARTATKNATGSLRQDPQINDDGDGDSNEKNEDGDVAELRYIGSAFVTGSDVPSIGNVTPSQVILTETEITLWASDILDGDDIVSVQCLITPPDYDSADDLIEIDLTWNAETERYENSYTFSEPGTYVCTFIAEDSEGNVSPPAQAVIMLPDAYETDDASAQATMFAIGETQSHNLHTTTDEDWVRFYAVPDFVYEIETVQLGTNSDTAIDIYYEEADGSLTLVESLDDNGKGEDDGEYTTLTYPTAGFYYVHVESVDGWELGSEYDININIPAGGGGSLMVIAVDKLNTSASPPNAVAILDGIYSLNFDGAVSVEFTGLSAGIHTVEVTVADGYLPDEDPSQADQANNLDNDLYGNPKRVEVISSSWAFGIFQFIPYARVTGYVRDEWTAERMAGVELAFQATSGTLSGQTYDGYPNYADYETNWYTLVDGSFPTNVFLPAGDWTVTLRINGYDDESLTSTLVDLEAGEVIDLSTLFMTPIDVDSDSLSDLWESLYFETGTSVEEDSDQDGLTDEEEYYAGTDPTDASSLLQLDDFSQNIDDGLITLTWPVVPGHSYSVLRMDSLMDSIWSVVGGPWESTNGQSSMEWSDSENLNGCFYRIEINHQ